jgi:hypothetical protein
MSVIAFAAAHHFGEMREPLSKKDARAKRRDDRA